MVIWERRGFSIFFFFFFVVTSNCWKFLSTIHWMTGGIINKKSMWSPINEEEGIICSCSSLCFPSCSPQSTLCHSPFHLPPRPGHYSTTFCRGPSEGFVLTFWLDSPLCFFPVLTFQQVLLSKCLSRVRSCTLCPTPLSLKYYFLLTKPKM